MQNYFNSNYKILFYLQGEIGFDGKMLRKAMARKTVDYNPSIIRYLEVSIFIDLSLIEIFFLEFYLAEKFNCWTILTT